MFESLVRQMHGALLYTVKTVSAHQVKFNNLTDFLRHEDSVMLHLPSVLPGHTKPAERCTRALLSSVHY